MNKIKRPQAIIYARFSPRPNADVEESCERQKQICTDYCKYKYEVAGYFEDKSLSGDDADRPGLWNAIDALKRGYTLVVRWRDRLARDVYLSEYLEKEVSRKGCKIVAAEESNGDTPQAVLVRQVLAAMAEYTKKIVQARTKYAMLKYQDREGRIMSCKLPYGYKPDPERRGYMIEELAEQEVIKKMQELYAVNHSYRGTGIELDLLGYKPRGAKEWSHRTIAKIIKRTGP